jgi:hypothetical protein
MDNQPSFDRSLLIPVGVAVFSLIGICGILVAGRVAAARANVQEIPTATPFKYALVGTEPAITTVTLEPTGLATPQSTEPPVIFNTSTSSSLSTPILLSPVATNALSSTSITTAAGTTSPIVNTKTPTRTPTSESSAPLNEGTFDDVYDHLNYSGSWDAQANVPGAHDNTLHVSGTLGDTVSFQFIGQELRVFFQAGPSLGTIRIHFNGSDYDMNENNSTTQTYEWVLPSVNNGTHEVTITHLSGGSVNLDYIIIPEVPVTPTKTPTPTATPR